MIRLFVREPPQPWRKKSSSLSSPIATCGNAVRNLFLQPRRPERTTQQENARCWASTCHCPRSKLGGIWSSVKDLRAGVSEDNVSGEGGQVQVDCTRGMEDGESTRAAVLIDAEERRYAWVIMAVYERLLARWDGLCEGGKIVAEKPKPISS